MLSGDAYSDNVSGPSWEAKHELQKRLGSFEAAVVNDAGPVYGTVGEDIVVLPDLSPDRLPDIVGARAIITEAGGGLAHLAVVSRENGVTIMRVADAISRYPEGTALTLLPAEGKIQVQAMRRDMAC